MIAPDPFSSAWHVISMSLVFIVGAVALISLGKKLESSATRALFLYIYHTSWCLVYFWYSNVYGSDSFGYFRVGLSGEADFGLGSEFIFFVVEILTTLLGLSYLGVFAVFNIFGSVGYLFFDASIRSANVGSEKWSRSLASIVILLPSISFWSSAISKDAISFMAVGLALWSSIDLGRRRTLMYTAIFAMFMVRPHMAALMVMSLSIAIFFEDSASRFTRVFLFIIFIIGASYIVPFALDYAGVKGEADIESVVEFIDKRQGYTKGDSAVDISNMSFLEKLFTYAFRPVLFEARSIAGLAASFDNMLLFFLFGYVLFLLLLQRAGRIIGNKKFILSYSLSAWCILSLTTANMGIAVRQKWMFLPFLLYFAFSCINRSRLKSREVV